MRCFARHAPSRLPPRPHLLASASSPRRRCRRPRGRLPRWMIGATRRRKSRLSSTAARAPKVTCANTAQRLACLLPHRSRCRTPARRCGCGRACFLEPARSSTPALAQPPCSLALLFLGARCPPMLRFVPLLRLCGPACTSGGSDGRYKLLLGGENVEYLKLRRPIYQRLRETYLRLGHDEAKLHTRMLNMALR